MQLTFKTLKNELFKLDVEASTTVGQLKEKIANERSMVLKSLKLIFTGNILKDAATIEDSGLKGADGEFIVLMGKAAPKASTTEPAPQKETPTPSEPTQDAEKKPDAVASQETKNQDASENSSDSKTEESPKDGSAMDTSNAPPSSGTEAQVEQLVNMGFTKDQAQTALRLAFGNTDRAAEYLTSGNMPAESDDQTNQPNTETPPSTSTPSTENSASNDSGPQPLSPDSPLYFLLNNPEFMQVRAFVQRQPNMLPALLLELTRNQPEMVRLINDNREDFYNLLNSPINDASSQDGIGGGGGRQQQIQVTPEENAAIDRLCAMGFDKALVVQAYFACDKNEELAANYLLEDN